MNLRIPFVTILIFLPSIRFSNVDLPTLGRPTIAAKPQRVEFSVMRIPLPTIQARRLPLPVQPCAGWYPAPALKFPAWLERIRLQRIAGAPDLSR